MNNIFRHSLTVLLLFLVIDSAAQTRQVKFNIITGTNGVSLGKINGMTMDKYGFMWFSDQSYRCIIRFDGSHMKRYQNDPKNPNSLGGYYPECLFADAEGNIWIGFYGMGLDKFDPLTNTFTHYRHNKNDPQSLSDDYVSAVLVDHLGNIWVGTNAGLDRLDEKTGKFKHFSNKANDPSSLSCNIVRAIYEDKAGDLWVGTGFAFTDNNEGGLNRLNRNTGTFTRYMNDPKNPQTLIDNKVRSIFEDSYGNFWIGTNGDGLHTMDRKTGLVTRYTYNPLSPGHLSRTPVNNPTDHITFITEDSDRKIWIGTLLNGIIRYDPVSKKVNRYGSRDDKSGIVKDSTSWWAKATPDGFIWYSTQNANLFKIDIYNTVIQHIGKSEEEGVFDFYEESASVCWFGTAKGLVRKDSEKGTALWFRNEPGNPNSLSNNQVYKIVKDKAGDFWIGTNSGLNQFNTRTGKFTRYYHDPVNKSDVGNSVSSIYIDADSNIWVGTYGGGLNMLNRKSGKFVNYRNDPSDFKTISNNFITAIFGDESNDLWIGNGNNGGLNRFNRQTGTFTRYLPGLNISCIYRDAKGIIWIGTLGDLLHYDRKSDSFISISDQDLGENIVDISSVIGDKDDNIWIGTETGIFMLNKTRDQIIRFGKEYGIAEANNFFYYGASVLRQDGELYLGNSTGYFAFYPGNLKSSTENILLFFTGFWINNKEIIPGKGGPLSESLFYVKEIRLSNEQNVFSLSATTIDFRNSTGRKIYYQLENYDEGWHSSGPEQRIDYFKVPPGNYIFRIKTADNKGGWVEKSIAIIVLPPWWSTWWALCLYGILFLVLVFIVHRYQKARLIKAERERARTIELAQAKEIEKAYTELKITQSQLIQSEKMASLGELTAGIAHEIQNPLNFVNNFSEVNTELIDELEQEVEKGNLDEVKALAKDIRENEQKINHHGKRADAIVKGMLQHSRSSSGLKEPTDINALTDEYLRLAYHGLRAKDKSFNATLKTDFDESIGKIDIIPQDMGRVILNLITNAFYAVDEKKKKLTLQRLENYEPTVSVSTKVDFFQTGGPGGVKITVSDNGSGIPQKVLDKIFQPFFTTKPAGQGTGLGLSMAYDIVKAHGGILKVETREGEGSEFLILLPYTIK